LASGEFRKVVDKSTEGPLVKLECVRAPVAHQVRYETPAAGWDRAGGVAHVKTPCSGEMVVSVAQDADPVGLGRPCPSSRSPGSLLLLLLGSRAGRPESTCVACDAAQRLGRRDIFPPRLGRQAPVAGNAAHPASRGLASGWQLIAPVAQELL